jgi:hypothetical protein
MRRRSAPGGSPAWRWTEDARRSEIARRRPTTSTGDVGVNGTRSPWWWSVWASMVRAWRWRLCTAAMARVGDLRRRSAEAKSTGRMVKPRKGQCRDSCDGDGAAASTGGVFDSRGPQRRRLAAAAE